MRLSPIVHHGEYQKTYEKNMSNIRYDIAIIGAGPAGMCAAIFAARNKKKVILCEQLKLEGAKIVISGGGKCNLTNKAELKSFISEFGTSAKFIAPTFNNFFSNELISFINNLQVPTACEDGFHIFPASKKSSDIVKALRKECKRLSVTILTKTKCNKLIFEGEQLAGIETEQSIIYSPKVIIATGGKSYKKCGGTGGGYPLAKQAGHKITKLFPAMVSLITEQIWPANCSGLTVPDASFFIDHPRYQNNVKNGSIMFTHTGITGLRVLDISGDIADLLQQNKTVAVRINFHSDMLSHDWFTLIKKWKRDSPKNRIHKLISSKIPQRLANILTVESAIDIGTKVDKLSEEQITNLIQNMTNYSMVINGTEGFDRAMVTRGGVKLKDISPDTMESKLLPGLYFAGEVLNVDGPCGGFNIQWAFSSGYTAGTAASR